MWIFDIEKSVIFFCNDKNTTIISEFAVYENVRESKKSCSVCGRLLLECLFFTPSSRITNIWEEELVNTSPLCKERLWYL